MPLLSTSEALHVSDSFLSSLYGSDIFRRWKGLKDEMKFVTEREYVSWLIDVANYYKCQDNSEQLSCETGIGDSELEITNRKGHSNISQHEQSKNCGVSKCESLERTGKGCDIRVKTEENVKSEPQTNEQYCSDQTQPGTNGSTECDIKSEPCDVNVRRPRTDNLLYRQADNLEYRQTDNLEYRQTDNLEYRQADIRPSGSQFIQQQQTYEDDCSENYREQSDDANLPHVDCEEILLSSDDDDDEIDQDDDSGSLVQSSLDTGMGWQSAEDSMPHDQRRGHKMYHCPHCNYQSRHRTRDIERHIKAVHEHHKPISCSYCDYKCASKSTLKNHLIHKHGYKSKYCCKICSKYFGKPSNLRQHNQVCK